MIKYIAICILVIIAIFDVLLVLGCAELEKENGLMESRLKEVDFYKLCRQCIHSDLDEKFDPCNECLELGMREGTFKPLFFKPKEE